MTDPFDSQKKEVPRDTFGRYRLYFPDDEKRVPKSWQRATSFAKLCDDTAGLMKWMGRMVAKGVATSDALSVKAADTDLEDKRAFDRIVEQAKQAAGANEAADNGTAIHTLTEKNDLGIEKFSVPARFRPHLEAYRTIIASLPIEIPAWGIERVVVLPELKVAGTFDRIVQFTADYTVQLGDREHTIRAGEWVICDVKSNKSLFYAQGSIAIQLALYSRARKMYNVSTEEYEDLPEINQDVALVFHVPSDTAKPGLYAMDINAGWEAVQLCQEVKKFRNNKKFASELEIQANPFASEEDNDWETRISKATSRAELSAVFKEASAALEWTKHLEKMGKDRIRELGL